MAKKSVVLSALIIILFFLNIARAEILINMQAVKTIESGGNPYSFNVETDCYGLYQISTICLEDFNQVNQKNYTPQDLFNPLINEMIAVWYFKRLNQILDFYGIPISITTVIASYNWGVGNVVRWHRNGARFEELPQETQNYIERYQQM